MEEPRAKALVERACFGGRNRLRKKSLARHFLFAEV